MTSEKWLIERRWEGGDVSCPVCGSESVSERKNRLPMPFQCNGCRKDFSVRSETLMHGSKMPLSVWEAAFRMIVEMPDDMTSYAAARSLGVSSRDAWSMLHRIRECWDDASRGGSHGRQGA